MPENLRFHLLVNFILFCLMYYPRATVTIDFHNEILQHAVI